MLQFKGHIVSRSLDGDNSDFSLKRHKDGNDMSVKNKKGDDAKDDQMTEKSTNVETGSNE